MHHLILNNWLINFCKKKKTQNILPGSGSLWISDITKFNNNSSSSCVDWVSCNIYSRTVDGLHSTIDANTSRAACLVVVSSRLYTDYLSFFCYQEFNNRLLTSITWITFKIPWVASAWNENEDHDVCLMWHLLERNYLDFVVVMFERKHKILLEITLDLFVCHLIDYHLLMLQITD